jgi:hypothetical protein
MLKKDCNMDNKDVVSCVLQKEIVSNILITQTATISNITVMRYGLNKF